ncbi:MAG: ribonuclease HII [Candidatus Micrarchaeota archaeon]
MGLIVGVDEAGRGCVIGPLVVCAFAIEEEKEQQLHVDGVRDSKVLAVSTRQRLHKELSKGKFAVAKVTAKELSELMGKRKNLNDIEASAMAKAIKELEEKHDGITRIFIDSPDAVKGRFEKRLRAFYKTKAPVVAENKADSRYPVVGAASIIAKEEREKEIAAIKKKVGFDFGSGYSHDEVTIAYLDKALKEKKHPINEFVRHSWETAKRLKVTQVKLGEYA